VSRWTGVAAHKVLVGVDGCGVTTFGLPLEAMAIAFARFAAAAERGDEVANRIFGAMRSRPFLVGGTDRFDTVILEETEGQIIAKVGAEGMHSVAVPERGVGIAIKVEDGSQRAQHAAVIRLLQLLGVLAEDLPPRLAAFARSPVVNTRGETVGELAPLA
jgi:L-asparaginase II